MPKKRLSDNISKLKATRSSQSSSPLFTYIYSTINELHGQESIFQNAIEKKQTISKTKYYKTRSLILRFFYLTSGEIPQ